MFYKITTDNNDFSVLYDSNVNNIIYNNTYYFRPNNLVPYPKSITIHFLLGTKCNYSCGYCAQHIVKNVITSPIKDYNVYINKIFSFIKSNFLFDETTNIFVSFIGGEPLLYFDMIVNIVKQLEQQYHISKYNIITNGSLLTDNITEFLLNNKIRCILSHDGPGQYIRNKEDYLLHDTEAKRSILKLHSTNNLVLAPTIHKYNYLISKYIDFFITNVGFTPNISAIHALRSYTDIECSYQLTELEYNKFDIDTINTLYPLDMSYNKNLFNRCIHIMGNNNLLYAPRCSGTHDNHFCVDTDGNIWTCANSYGIYQDSYGGNLYRGNIYTSVYFDRQFIQREKILSSLCIDCMYKYFCRGGCVLNNLDNIKYVCMSRKHEFFVEFMLFLHKLFGKVFTKIIPIQN